MRRREFITLVGTAAVCPLAARAQHDLRVRRIGVLPLIDRIDIYAFEKWWKRVEAMIARADTVVFVLSHGDRSKAAVQGCPVRGRYIRSSNTRHV